MTWFTAVMSAGVPPPFPPLVPLLFEELFPLPQATNSSVKNSAPVIERIALIRIGPLGSQCLVQHRVKMNTGMSLLASLRPVTEPEQAVSSLRQHW